MAELIGILGEHYRSSQQLKFKVTEKQQTVHKFVQQCCFFQNEYRTSNLQIRHTTLPLLQSFTNPFYFPKEKINYTEVNLKFKTRHYRSEV